MNRSFQRPETVRVWAYITAEGVKDDPSENVLLTITDPDGTAKLTSGVMTKSTTGEYYYDWTSSSSDTEGWYKTKVVVTDGTGALAKVTITYGGFRLE
jgi:hypothetical protein